jgi:hypothetical protein
MQVERGRRAVVSHLSLALVPLAVVADPQEALRKAPVALGSKVAFTATQLIDP